MDCTLFYTTINNCRVKCYEHTNPIKKEIFLRSLGHPGGYFGFYRQCSIAGIERVSLTPLGWFFGHSTLTHMEHTQDMKQTNQRKRTGQS